MQEQAAAANDDSGESRESVMRKSDVVEEVSPDAPSSSPAVVVVENVHMSSETVAEEPVIRAVTPRRSSITRRRRAMEAPEKPVEVKLDEASESVADANKEETKMAPGVPSPAAASPAVPTSTTSSSPETAAPTAVALAPAAKGQSPRSLAVAAKRAEFRQELLAEVDARVAVANKVAAADAIAASGSLSFSLPIGSKRKEVPASSAAMPSAKFEKLHSQARAGQETLKEHFARLDEANKRNAAFKSPVAPKKNMSKTAGASEFTTQGSVSSSSTASLKPPVSAARPAAGASAAAAAATITTGGPSTTAAKQVAPRPISAMRARPTSAVPTQSKPAAPIVIRKAPGATPSAPSVVVTAASSQRPIIVTRPRPSNAATVKSFTTSTSAAPSASLAASAGASTVRRPFGTVTASSNVANTTTSSSFSQLPGKMSFGAKSLSTTATTTNTFKTPIVAVARASSSVSQSLAKPFSSSSSSSSSALPASRDDILQSRMAQQRVARAQGLQMKAQANKRAALDAARARAPAPLASV